MFIKGKLVVDLLCRIYSPKTHQSSSERLIMKAFFILILAISPLLSEASSGVSGKVSLTKSCGKKVMVWLSLDKENYNERLLLMHTEVPQGGSFQFNLKPGLYQVRATDEKGCEFMQKIKINDSFLKVAVAMVKK